MRSTAAGVPDQTMPATAEDLAHLLHRLDGCSYKAYAELAKGPGYRFSQPYPFQLFVDHVQADPYARPSRLRLHLPLSVTGLPAQLLDGPNRRAGLCHGLALAVGRAVDGLLADQGQHPLLDIDRPGQQILQRTCVQIHEDDLTVRLAASLPAAGRRIRGIQAAEILCDRLPEIVGAALIADRDTTLARSGPSEAGQLDLDHLDALATAAANAAGLREQLQTHGLVAFIADGSRLPRHSGIDDRPLTANAIPWQSPDALRVELDGTDGNTVTGTGLRRGVTAIVGGGFHGKSTLLDALRLGVYSHVPGDGREQVITDPTAVAIRAEDGRRVCGVDLSAFIGPLPFDRRTDHFTSDDASGATSQAAAIVEALDLGCRLLLIDEDTAATNFMARDARMRQLIAPDREPITPFIDRARQLAEEGVSTILVTGGSSDFLGVADTVIAMDAYRPADVSARAHKLVPPTREPTDPLPDRGRRIPDRCSIDPRKGRRERVATARGRHTVEIGRQRIDLMALTQLVDTSQTRALAQALLHAHDHHMDGIQDLADICAAVVDEIESVGLDSLCPGHHYGDLAGFRRFELAATLNRLRTLQVDASPGAPA